MHLYLNNEENFGYKLRLRWLTEVANRYFKWTTYQTTMNPEERRRRDGKFNFGGYNGTNYPHLKMER